MKRTILGFELDHEGHWVAQLNCLHGQHVRHRPPFTLRPWTQTEGGRQQMLGTTLECLKCERRELPEGLVEYRATPEFDEKTLPAGLRRDHATKQGVWGILEVLTGSLRYEISSPFGHQEQLDAPAQAVIVPETLHRVVPLGAVRLCVRFLRADDRPSADAELR